MEISLNCTKCPIHCEETVDEINARSDSSVRHWSLGLSCLTTVMLLSAYIYSWITTGKVMPIPDIVWAFALSPLGSATVQKAFDFFGKKK